MNNPLQNLHEYINSHGKHWPSGIEAMVCEDIAKRQELGIAKYGTTVAQNPLELRAWLQHLYEEQLDACVYVRRAIEELDKNNAS